MEAEDEKFKESVKEAKSKNKVLRYVAMLDARSEKPVLTVGLKPFPKESDFGGLKGTANLVRVETEILKNPVPHVIKSRGAGLEVTAGAVRVGIARMLPFGLERK